LLELKGKEIYINLLSLITTHEWYSEIALIIKGESFTTIVLIDSIDLRA